MHNLEQLQHELIGKEPITENLSLLCKPRFDHLETIIKELNENNIPGDIIETGCWRGGACIYIRAILDSVNDTNRYVYAADSFQGVPKPDLENFPIDSYSTHYKSDLLKVSLEEVQENFKKYGYLDDRTIFIPGWFKDTITNLKPKSGKWSILRLDGDIYESTIQVLNALYDDLSVGGYVIIDDFGSDIGASHATRDFFYKIGKIDSNEITPSELKIDRKGLSAYWQK